MATFFRVTLPMARRGVLYGSLLSFSRAMGEFGATALVAEEAVNMVRDAARDFLDRPSAFDSNDSN